MKEMIIIQSITTGAGKMEGGEGGKGDGTCKANTVHQL